MSSSVSNPACPICGTTCDDRVQEDLTSLVDCARCGRFRVTPYARDEARTLTSHRLAGISAALAD